MEKISDSCKKKAREKGREIESGRTQAREGHKRFDRSGRNFHRNWQKISKTRRQWRTMSGRREKERDWKRKGRKRERGGRGGSKEKEQYKRETARVLPVGIRCLYTSSQV